jgi:hypothetical protein
VRAALRKIEEEVLRDHVRALRRARHHERRPQGSAAEDHGTDGRRLAFRPVTESMARGRCGVFSQ